MVKGKTRVVEKVRETGQKAEKEQWNARRGREGGGKMKQACVCE